ncbi:MAG: hypothetical protein Q9207_002979 [Kuettlingeria erythrocarpa]
MSAGKVMKRQHGNLPRTSTQEVVAHYWRTILADMREDLRKVEEEMMRLQDEHTRLWSIVHGAEPPAQAARLGDESHPGRLRRPLRLEAEAVENAGDCAAESDVWEVQ